MSQRSQGFFWCQNTGNLSEKAPAHLLPLENLLLMKPQSLELHSVKNGFGRRRFDNAGRKSLCLCPKAFANKSERGTGQISRVQGGGISVSDARTQELKNSGVRSSGGRPQIQRSGTASQKPLNMYDRLTRVASPAKATKAKRPALLPQCEPSKARRFAYTSSHSTARARVAHKYLEEGLRFGPMMAFTTATKREE